MTDHPQPAPLRQPLARTVTDRDLDHLELTDPLQALEHRRTRAVVGAVEALQDVVVEQRQEASGERDAETAVVVKALEDVSEAVDALRTVVERRLPFHDWTSVLIHLVRTAVLVVGVCAVLAFMWWLTGAPTVGGVIQP